MLSGFPDSFRFQSIGGHNQAPYDTRWGGMRGHQISRGMRSKGAAKPYAAVALFSFLLVSGASLIAGSQEPNLLAHPNPNGVAKTFSTQGSIDLGSDFFQSLGTNGRTCASCHAESDGWSVTPPHIQARFDASQGMDPIFHNNDGANCPSADQSTVDSRRAASSMLLNKGLIRVSIGVPPGAEFSVVSIHDPYSCPENTASGLALFRRPLPATNLRFDTTVMWDGRESPKGRSLHDSLMSQAMDATTGHAQGAVPTAQQLEDIVAFESGLYTAQTFDWKAGQLHAQGGQGGPVVLSSQQFYPGINDPLGGNPTGAAFDPNGMTLYSAWADLRGGDDEGRAEDRRSVARGEQIFNTHPIMISGVPGLNDNPALGPAFMGTCTTCHSTPNVGNHSVALAIDIGVTDAQPAAPLDTSGLPVYVLRCNATGQTYTVTDPGRALITGKCADIGKTKGPILRGLSARAPYFHNGSAASLRDAVEFYNNRFHIGFSEQEMDDLVNFLRTL